MPEKGPNTDLDEFDPVRREEWDFDCVPDAEIVACCLWEYARESASITMASQIEWCNTRGITYRDAYQRDPRLKLEHEREADRIGRMVEAAEFDYGVFVDRFFESERAWVDIYQSLKSYVGEGGRPWQSLPVQIRKRLSKEVGESLVLKPLQLASVGDLEVLWNANREELDAVRSKARPANDDSEDAALYAESQPETLRQGNGTSTGNMAVAFAVDFTRFTDREISDVFLSWLKANRPKEWKRPLRVFPGTNQKGRKLLDYRVALERLGLMRLLHFHSPAMLSEKLPEAWKKIRRKEKDFHREIRAASKLFRRLFPFLSENERPYSEARYGVWSPPLHKLMEEMDRERGINRGRK